MSRARPSRQPDDLPPWTNVLGRRLREIRSSRGESLASVGAATGVSSSFLSLLEQGRTDVSLGRLLPVLDHYGLGIEEVFANGRAPRESVVRADERTPVFSIAEGVEVFLAAPDRRHPFTPFVVEYRRESAMTSWSEHAGEEFIFVLEGSLALEFRDEEPVVLHHGDSIFFPSTTPHRISSAEGDLARALVVSTEARVATT
ncbi:cupin domain-containing protein [Blastococcus montanus]|uniref:helix-turn-helix domain-containing protein n=1 Tax=Blastococcus montanus TaxID=3144973 RepID=UPI0032095947